MVTESADTETRREDRIPVNLSQPIALEVHNSNGDVTVRAVDRSDVLISHVKHGLPGGIGDDVELVIDARDNRIEVRVIRRNGFEWGGVTADIDLEAVVGQITKAFRWGGPWASGKPGKAHVASGSHAWIDVAIDVPREISGRVEVHTASGDVRVEDVASEMALKTASGDIRVVRAGGDLLLQTASGDLVAEGANGRLTAQSASGDVRISSARLTDFRIQTASGDIFLDAMLAGAGPCRAQSVSGDVRLTLRPPGAAGEEPAATIAFQSVSGDAHVAPPFRKTARRLWRAGSGDGGPRIDVKTVSGDLTAGFAAAESAFAPASNPISSTDDVLVAPPVPPAPPTEPLPPGVSWQRGGIDLSANHADPEAGHSTAHGDAARHAVLEAVERGEIDVEEALRRLEAADASTSP